MSEAGRAWLQGVWSLSYASRWLEHSCLYVGMGLAEPVLAQVPRIQGQGTAASGMGNAFSAQADDPSALHYNPAGMTQLHGVEFMTGVLLSGEQPHSPVRRVRPPPAIATAVSPGRRLDISM